MEKIACFTFWKCGTYLQQSSFIGKGRECIMVFSETDYALVYGSEFIFIRYFKAFTFLGQESKLFLKLWSFK